MQRGCAAGQARGRATQVTLQATAVSYQKTSRTLDGGSASSSSSLTGFGLFGSGLGAGVGYEWDHVGFGTRANIQSMSDGDNSANLISFFPRIE